ASSFGWQPGQFAVLEQKVHSRAAFQNLAEKILRFADSEKNFRLFFIVNVDEDRVLRENTGVFGERPNLFECFQVRSALELFDALFVFGHHITAKK
ncbi:MAG: hypothetical protein MJ072_06975, partial [Clostridia bacterium]|nr:hypothetical protein [Clostridia bacterium]